MMGIFVCLLFGVFFAVVVGLWLFGERGHLLLPSTVKGVKAIGLRNVLNLKVIHAYVYGRWSNQYIDILINHFFPRLKARGKQYWADHYHGKILTTEHARTLITLNRNIPLRDLEQIIPYAKARSFVLDGPPDIALYECPCRHASPNPCWPTQVCLIIGQPFVDCLLEHNPHSTRRITPAEALQVLEEEHNREHFHSAWFKDVMLDRFFAVCNCCKCCCGGVRGMMYGIPMMASSGYVAYWEKDFCGGCGTCIDRCPFEALSLDESKVVINWEKCMGCGVCVGQCPCGALSLVRDERKGVPLDVMLLK